MTFTTIFMIATVALLAIFFVIARLAVRWIVRLTIIGIILIALLGGGAFWWWTTRLAPKPKPRPNPTRRSMLTTPAQPGEQAFRVQPSGCGWAAHNLKVEL